MSELWYLVWLIVGLVILMSIGAGLGLALFFWLTRSEG